MKPYIFGFLLLTIGVAAVGLAMSLMTGQARGCFDYGVILMTTGGALKFLVDTL